MSGSVVLFVILLIAIAITMVAAPLYIVLSRPKSEKLKRRLESQNRYAMYNRHLIAESNQVDKVSQPREVEEVDLHDETNRQREFSERLRYLESKEIIRGIEASAAADRRTRSFWGYG